MNRDNISNLARQVRDDGYCNPYKLKAAGEAREKLREMGVELDSDGWPVND